MNQTYKIVIAISVILAAAFFYIIFNRTDSVPLSNVPVQEQPQSSKVVIAFGDSLTAGYNLPAQESYPAQLESRLREAGVSVRVINSGVSGETTRGNLERAQFIRDQKSDVVIIGIGGNDALRSLPVAETKSNIERTIQILQSGEKPPRVVLLQMQAPLNAGVLYKKAFDQIYVDIKNTYGIELVPFVTQEIFFDSNNVLSDGIHLNKKGYGEVVERYILPAVMKIL